MSKNDAIVTLSSETEKSIKIITEKGDEKIITKGVVISFDGDCATGDMTDIAPIDVVRAAVFMLKTLDILEYGNLFEAYMHSQSDDDEDKCYDEEED